LVKGANKEVGGFIFGIFGIFGILGIESYNLEKRESYS
jgi:hypothetical protein